MITEPPTHHIQNHIPLSWENDLGEDELYEFLNKNPALFLASNTTTPRRTNLTKLPPQRRTILPSTKSFKPSLTHLSREKLQTFSIEDLKVLRKRKTKFVSAFSISSPYLPEGFRQKPLADVLASFKYCSSFDAESFMFKRIRGKAFLRMRRLILNFIRSVSKLNKAHLSKDMSLVLTPGLKSLTQRSPKDLVIQKSLQLLIIDSFFHELTRNRAAKPPAKHNIRRAMDKIVRSQDLCSLVLKQESIQNVLQNQDELQRLLEHLPKLKEFILGIDFGYRTFWAPQFRHELANKITYFHMRYKSGSHGQEPRSPLFDFLDIIDTFGSLKSFCYEETDGIHWSHQEALEDVKKLNKLQRIPLKEIYLNMFFGSQEPGFEHVIIGFFENLMLPSSTEKFTLYARFHDLISLNRAQRQVECFKNLQNLAKLKCFDLGLIADALITRYNAKEEQPKFIVDFFQQALQFLDSNLQELSMATIKSCDSCSRVTHQDKTLLQIITDKFQLLKNLSLEFPCGSVELLYPNREEEGSYIQIQSLSIIGCNLPLLFCQKLDPNKFEALTYNATKGINLECLISCLDAVSRFTFLKQIVLVFAGCDKYDMRGEILEKIVNIFRRIRDLREFTMFLDVRIKRNVLDWLMKLVNLKKGLTHCRLNFYHYGLVKPYLISKEDYWLKNHMERTRKFLLN